MRMLTYKIELDKSLTELPKCMRDLVSSYIDIPEGECDLCCDDALIAIDVPNEAYKIFCKLLHHNTDGIIEYTELFFELYIGKTELSTSDWVRKYSTNIYGFSIECIPAFIYDHLDYDELLNIIQQRDGIVYECGYIFTLYDDNATLFDRVKQLL